MADIIKVDVTQPANKIAVNISDRGQKGDAGADGATGADGADGATGADGADGADGVGVPTGGATGQVLSKSSAVDYATTWVDQASGNPFNQNLNTTDSPEFQGLTLTGRLTGEGITAESTVEVVGDNLDIYSVLGKGTNFEKLSMSVDALGDATIATSSGGTGDDGDLVLAPASKNTRVDGSLDLSGSSSNSIKLYGSAEIKGGSIRLRSGTANYLWLDSWATTSFRIWSDARGLSINNTTAGTYPVNISPAGEFRVYSDLDDPSGTFERVSMSVDANGDATIATESGGMGDDGDLILAPASGVIDVNGDARFRARIIRSKSVYVGTDTTDDVALHVCDSATAFTLTVTDGADDGEEIKIVNRGAGTVTLSGKINTTTAVASLASGETIVLNWDATDDEWQ